MGLLKDLGRRTVIISGGSQYTLEEGESGEVHGGEFCLEKGSGGRGEAVRD